MIKKSSLIFGSLRVPVDLVFTFASFFIAYQIRSRTDLIPGVQLPIGVFPPWSEYLFFSGVASVFLLLVFAINGHYDLRRKFRFFHELARIIFSVSAWIALIIAFFFLTRQLFFSRLVLAYAWILVIAFVFVGRVVVAFFKGVYVRIKKDKIRVLLIGAGRVSQIVSKGLKSDYAYKVVGVLNHKPTFRFRSGLRMLGDIADLATVVKHNKVDEIILTKDLGRKKLGNFSNYYLLRFCRTHHIRFRFIPDILYFHDKNIEVDDLSGLPVIECKPTSLDGWGSISKRMFDLFGSLFLIMVLLPVLVSIAVLIKATSRGPMLFSYLRDKSLVMRVGQKGRLFHYFKFRTMIQNAHSLRSDPDFLSKVTDLREGTPMMKFENDPRVNLFGRFLRKYSLDELPELFLVFIGKMSLVGPRPHLPEEVSKYSDLEKRVLAIKPGMTGAAQISGRSDLSFEDEVRIDLGYIENWSFVRDVEILIKTVKVVLFSGHSE